jgi:hypothetical protein
MPCTISPHPPPDRSKSPAVPPKIEPSAPREVFMPAYGSTGRPHTHSGENGGNDQLTKPGDTEIAERKDPSSESRFNPSDRGTKKSAISTSPLPLSLQAPIYTREPEQSLGGPTYVLTASNARVSFLQTAPLRPRINSEEPGEGASAAKNYEKLFALCFQCSLPH